MKMAMYKMNHKNWMEAGTIVENQKINFARNLKKIESGANSVEVHVCIQSFCFQEGIHQSSCLEFVPGCHPLALVPRCPSQTVVVVVLCKLLLPAVLRSRLKLAVIC
jgi:hypothetical protein